MKVGKACKMWIAIQKGNSGKPLLALKLRHTVAELRHQADCSSPGASLHYSRRPSRKESICTLSGHEDYTIPLFEPLFGLRCIRIARIGPLISNQHRSPKRR